MRLALANFNAQLGFPSTSIQHRVGYVNGTHSCLYIRLLSLANTSLQSSQHFDWPTNISIEVDTTATPLHNSPTSQNGVRKVLRLPTRKRASRQEAQNRGTWTPRFMATAEEGLRRGLAKSAVSHRCECLQAKIFGVWLTFSGHTRKHSLPDSR